MLLLQEEQKPVASIESGSNRSAIDNGNPLNSNRPKRKMTTRFVDSPPMATIRRNTGLGVGIYFTPEVSHKQGLPNDKGSRQGALVILQAGKKRAACFNLSDRVSYNAVQSAVAAHESCMLAKC